MAATTNYKEFWALLKLMPGATKEDIVFAYSQGETESLSQFAKHNLSGYNRMLAEMRKRAELEQNRETKRLRSAILTRLQRHGVDTTNWANVNAFLEQPRIAGQRLYDMTHDDMHALIPKLESILRKDVKHRENLNKLAQQN